MRTQNAFEGDAFLFPQSPQAGLGDFIFHSAIKAAQLAGFDPAPEL